MAMRTEIVLLLLMTICVRSWGSKVCSEPKDSGSCDKYVVKYFYDNDSGRCRRFWYGGCGGNGNQFDSLEFCEKKCANAGLHQDDADNTDQNEIPESEILFEITNNGHSSVSDPCELPSDSGPCRNHSVKWFFDSKKQDCGRFWYGGCQGNENRFDDSEACKRRCSKESNKHNLPVDTQGHTRHHDKFPAECQHPKDAGNCANYTLHWYFDPSSATCRQFWHGGCGGNSNRFTSIEECEAKCLKGERDAPAVRPVSVANAGCANSVYGCCPDQQMAAQGLNYKGCKESCEDSIYGCCPDGITPAEGQNQDGCEISSGNVPCEQTQYGCCSDGINTASGPSFKGCPDTPDSENTLFDANNNVITKVATEKKCTAPESRDVCTEYTLKWRFDSQKQECVRHWWGGCADNGNVFESKEDCDNECKKTVVITQPVSPKQGTCTAPESRDLCTKFEVKWRFDNKKQECVRHWWGGCEDNGNVFESEADCEAVCMKTVVITNPDTVDPDFVSICDMEVDTGPCEDNIRRYYYDPRDRRCKLFYYGGCQGNENNFIGIEDCQRQCMGGVDISHSATTTKPQTSTFITAAARTTVEPAENVRSSINMSGQSTAEKGSTVHIRCSAVGPVQPIKIEWFFNGKLIEAKDIKLSVSTVVNPQMKQALVSELVIKNFDQENAGSYHCRSKPYGDLEKMLITVAEEERVTPASTDQRNPAAVCLMKAESGPCYANKQRWHYDHLSGTCLQFVYGGCAGNNNNFATMEDCSSYCNEEEVCLQTKKVGPCRAAIPRFYFDSSTRSCQNFIYGGCAGNLNNFATREACDKKCHYYKHPGSSVDVVITDEDEDSNVCQLKAEKGNCRGYNIKWYYSADRKQCARFVYTGCGGNGNQFDSEQECSDRCLKDENTDDRYSVTETFPTTQSTHFYPKSFSTVSVPHEARGDPRSVLVKLGDTIILTCSLRNHGVLWYHDGFLLASNSKFQVYNNGTLFLLTVTEDMAGSYTCTISNGYNVPQMEKFKVHVYAPPKVLPGPALISAKPGNTAVVHCQAVGSPEPVISWNRGGRVLLSSSHYSVFANGTLVIHNVLIHDAGEYECTADNGIAATTKKITLSIKEIIGADIQSHQGIFSEGETIRLHCKGTGYPTPKLEWVKEGNVLKSDEKIQVVNGDLTVTAATIEDAGMYKCIAFNERDKAEDVTTVQINFHNPLAKCEDNMRRTQCHLIVTGRLCGFRIFTSKCCHSCRKAGFL